MRATLIPESYALFPQTTAPASPVAGQVYLDGTVSPPVYKQWNSVTLAWEEFGTGGAATQAVVARAHTSASQFTDNTVPINFDTVDFDSGSAVTTGAAWKFTAPTTGYYNVSTVLLPTAASISIALYKNGSPYVSPWMVSIAVTSGYSSGSTTIQLNAGDYLDIRADTTGITIADGSVSITLAAGIASGTTVAARAYQAASTAFGALATIAFDTVEFDTSGALSAGVFTAPVSGKYQVSGAMQVISGTDILLYKNGALKEYLLTAGPNTQSYGSLVSLVEGDTIDIRLANADTVNGIPSTPVSYFNVALVSAIEPVNATLTSWAAYTPTTQGFGTITSANFFWRRVNDTLEVKGSFVAGTTTATTAQVSLPSGLNADPSKLVSVVDGALVGTLITTQTGPVSYSVLCKTDTNPDVFRFGISLSGLSAQNARDAIDIVTSGDSLSFYASVPILEWA